MVYYLLFEKEEIKIIDSNQKSGLTHYALVERSLSSNLGFYNWIIDPELSLIGINFLLIDKRSPVLTFFLASFYNNVQVNEREVYVFFSRDVDFSMDYSNEFINFDYYESKDGSIALSFEVPDNFEYQIDFLLDCVKKGRLFKGK